MRDIFKNVLIWGIIFFIGSVIYQVSSIRISVNKNVIQDKKWYPNYSLALFQDNEKYLSLNITQNQVNQVKENAVQGLKRAPLSHLPFLHVGMANVLFNGSENNRALFSEVLDRDGRNRRALRMLVHLDASKEDYKSVVSNLDKLLNLKGNKAVLDQYHDTLLYLSANEVALKIIDGYLSQRPKWGKAFLLNRIKKLTVDNFSNIGESIKAYSNNQIEKKILEEYFANLIKLGLVEQAYDFWKSLAPASTADSSYLINNPEFQNMHDPAPFNWSTVMKRPYFSEIEPEGGLYASFDDTEKRVLSEQIINLKPGFVYRIAINGGWNYTRRQGLFFWSIKCLDNQAIIAKINFDELSKENLGGEYNFEVPETGCKFQSLRLSAEPGQYSQRIWSRTKSVNISLSN